MFPLFTVYGFGIYLIYINILDIKLKSMILFIIDKLGEDDLVTYV